MNASNQPASPSELRGKTVMVVGASRGLGRGIVTTFAAAGAAVIAVSRTAPATAARDGNSNIQWETFDAAAATSASSLIDRHRPDIIVLVAGATPHMVSLRQQTWETFSIHWETDVRIAFHWLRASLLKPLRPGSRVIVVSSGAAMGGSPLSGGYAGSKATQRFITSYAQDEATRAGLDIAFTAILPRFAPETGVGRAAVQAYAARSGVSTEEYLRTFRESSGPPVTPEIAGAALLQLAQADGATLSRSYLLTGDGLEPLP
jgi:NAD(P)-dependent dehydrogenase (short-subunit alcohol dehydrogenase family)